MKLRSGLAAATVLGLSLFISQPAFAQTVTTKGYNNGGSGDGLCCDDTPGVVTSIPRPVVVPPAPVVAAPTATVNAPVATVATTAPDPGSVTVLGETISNANAAEIIAKAPTAIASAPAAIASAAVEQAPISFTGAYSILMAGAAAALIGLGAILVAASRRKRPITAR